MNKENGKEGRSEQNKEDGKNIVFDSVFIEQAVKTIARTWDAEQKKKKWRKIFEIVVAVFGLLTAVATVIVLTYQYRAFDRTDKSVAKQVTLLGIQDSTLKTQLDAIIRQDTLLSIQTRELQKANRISSDALIANKKGIEISNSPSVDISPPQFEPIQNGKPLTVVATIKNTGEIPINIRFWFCKGNEAMSVHGCSDVRKYPWDILAPHTSIQHFAGTKAIPITEEALSDIKSGKTAVYVYGTAEYRSRHKEKIPYRLRYCWGFDAKNQNWIECDSVNNAD